MTLADVCRQRKQRVVDVARRLVHGAADADGAPLGLETLTAAVSDYEAALARATEVARGT